MRERTARAGAALASVLLAFAVALPASAQQPAPPVPPPDEAEITKFTEAHLDIEEISKDVEAKVAAAQTEEEKTQIREEGEQRAAAALEARQIEKVRYQQIAALVESDAELRARFEALREKILEARKGGG